MNRAMAREHLMYCIFQMDIKQSFEWQDVQPYLESSLDGTDQQQLDLYIKPMLLHFCDAQVRQEIDHWIERHLKNWTLDRLNRVELAVLRLALLEMRFGSDIPHKVSINEAVNLANKFGSDTSGAFVNGVLGEAVKELLL